MTKILALDLGTTTGFCCGTAEHHVSGTWNNKQSRYDGGCQWCHRNQPEKRIEQFFRHIGQLPAVKTGLQSKTQCQESVSDVVNSELFG